MRGADDTATPPVKSPLKIGFEGAIAAAERERLLAAVAQDYAAGLCRTMALSMTQAESIAGCEMAEALGRDSERHELGHLCYAGEPHVVGSYWFGIDRQSRNGHLYFIGIRPAHRGQGFAMAAMLAWHARAKTLGCRQVSLRVFADNAATCRLYAAAGYGPAAVEMVRSV